MIVMPANSTGWFWHCLARETGRIGHLYSPDAQRGPWPWFSYALDNGAFSCWDMRSNTFDDEKWAQTEVAWKKLVYWARNATIQPRWAIAPDVPGDATRTIQRYTRYAGYLVSQGIKPAVAVQDNMTVSDVKRLIPEPVVICVGGTTEFKWNTVELWKGAFERVHVLRCNSPEKLYYLEGIGVESCDGTGWNRGDQNQTYGVEQWARSKPGKPNFNDLWSYCCKQRKKNAKEHQQTWAWDLGRTQQESD